MRILLWHGYLLSGTGSNIYTQALAREWGRAGHDVVLFSQEPHPELFDLAGADAIRPEIGGILPVFVLDRYAGLTPRRLQDLSPAELARYVDANVSAMHERLPADVVFLNHVLPGGAVGAALGAPFAVKAHGSELEYSMRGNERLAALGREALGRAKAVFVGSPHIRNALEEVVGPVEHVREVPPGVDVEEFVPRNRAEALAGLLEQARADPPNPGNADERLPDEGNAERLSRFLATDGPVVLYFGKLMENKGVQVLLEALRRVRARALIVGFGDYREQLEALAPEGTLFTGALEHRHLTYLLPLADVTVVPSIFPEAFGMVGVAAAAAASPPLVARHSGLAVVAAGIEAEYPPERRRLASFPTGDAAALAERLDELLSLPEPERRRLGLAARRAAVERWSWRTVAERLLEPFVAGAAAARSRLT